MKRSLLALLESPCCRGPLALRSDADPGAEVLAGQLECSSCQRRYPVRAGVPRFVADDAYTGNFSFEWTRYDTLQLDSRSGHRWSHDAFRERTGFPLESLRGKRVLDVGCGTGRFSEVVLDAGGEVVGVDLSFAVDVAMANVGRRDGAHVVQADVFALPFKACSFDVIFSLGVLHHTPDTRRAFLALPGLLRSGGRLAIWVYARGRWHRVFGDLLRLLTTRLPQRHLHTLCRLAVPAIQRLRKLPLLGLPFFLIPVSDGGRGLEADVLDTFDWYSPRYQWKHEYAEVEGWFREAGLKQVERLSFPVAVRGEK